MKCWFILTSWLGKPQHLTWQFCLKHWWKLCQKCYVGICTLTFMFKSGIKAARLGLREIILFILQSQAGSAGLKLYLSVISLTSQPACGGHPKMFLDSPAGHWMLYQWELSSQHLLQLPLLWHEPNAPCGTAYRQGSLCCISPCFRLLKDSRFCCLQLPGNIDGAMTHVGSSALGMGCRCFYPQFQCVSCIQVLLIGGWSRNSNGNHAHESQK